MGYFRDRLTDALTLISRADYQIEYQRRAPVNVANQLFSQWEDWYLPDDPDFLEEFGERERAVLAEFATVMDQVADDTPPAMPSLEEFMATPEWVRLRDAAVLALRESRPS